MTSRKSIAAFQYATQPPLLRGALSSLVWLQGELIIGLADAPGGGGVAGLLVALALRVVVDLILVSAQGIANRVLTPMPRLFIQSRAGSSEATDILRQRYLQTRLSGISRVLLTVSLVATLAADVPALDSLLAANQGLVIIRDHSCVTSLSAPSDPSQERSGNACTTRSQNHDRSS
jgi:hypothetical protein